MYILKAMISVFFNDDKLLFFVVLVMLMIGYFTSFIYFQIFHQVGQPEACQWCFYSRDGKDGGKQGHQWSVRGERAFGKGTISKHSKPGKCLWWDLRGEWDGDSLWAPCYLMEQTIPRSVNSLHFWRANATQFPSLAAVAAVSLCLLHKCGQWDTF